MIILIYFIIISFVIAYIDSKKRIIPDKVIIPAFVGLLILKWLDIGLSLNDAIAVVLILVIFLIPIILNMAFGGGDLRYGAFCALFVELGSIGYFILFSGMIHLILLTILKKKSYGFAPAMSVAAIISYGLGSI